MDRRRFLAMAAATAAAAPLPGAAQLASRVDPGLIAEDPRVRLVHWPWFRHSSPRLDTRYLDPLPIVFEDGARGADPLAHPACRCAGAVAAGIRECRLPPPHAAYNASTVFMAGALAADTAGAYDQTGLADRPAEPGADPVAAYIVAVCDAAAALFRAEGDSGFTFVDVGPPVNFSWDFMALEASLLSAIPDGPAKEAGARRGAAIAEEMVRRRPRLWAALDLDMQPSEWRARACPETPDWMRETPELAWVETTPGVGLEPYFRMGYPIAVRMAETPVFAAGEDGAFDLSDHAADLARNLEDSLEPVAKWGGYDSPHRPPFFDAVGFLFEDGASGPPTGVSHVLTALIARLDLPVAEAARWQALVWAALHRAGNEVWREKYCRNILRPQTAMDRFWPGAWTNGPAIPSPTFPAYPSGHSCFGASGYRTMLRLLAERGVDGDALPLWMAAPDPDRWLRQLTRDGDRIAIRFGGLSALAEAGGFSRTACGGIHFWHDDIGGQRIGEAAASLAYRSLLKPQRGPHRPDLPPMRLTETGALAERWAVEAAERRGRPAPDLARLDPFPNAPAEVRAALPPRWLASGMRASYA